jgi:hypothetical protein
VQLAYSKIKSLLKFKAYTLWALNFWMSSEIITMSDLSHRFSSSGGKLPKTYKATINQRSEFIYLSILCHNNSLTVSTGLRLPHIYRQRIKTNSTNTTLVGSGLLNRWSCCLNPCQFLYEPFTVQYKILVLVEISHAVSVRGVKRSGVGANIFTCTYQHDDNISHKIMQAQTITPTFNLRNQ